MILFRILKDLDNLGCTRQLMQASLRSFAQDLLRFAGPSGSHSVASTLWFPPLRAAKSQNRNYDTVSAHMGLMKHCLSEASASSTLIHNCLVLRNLSSPHASRHFVAAHMGLQKCASPRQRVFDANPYYSSVAVIPPTALILAC